MGWRGILGFEYGIVCAPLGPDISGPELVAAVANSGGLALLRAPDWVCHFISLCHSLHFFLLIDYPLTRKESNWFLVLLVHNCIHFSIKYILEVDVLIYDNCWWLIILSLTVDDSLLMF